MRKILATAFATTLIAAASVAATTPANAISFHFGVGGFGYHHYAPHVYVEAPVVYDSYSDWDLHADWCSKYKTWNPKTNLYYYVPGKQKPCISPYGPH